VLYTLLIAMLEGSVRALHLTYAIKSGIRHSQLARGPKFQLPSVRAGAGILPGSANAVFWHRLERLLRSESLGHRNARFWPH
jgi:hypothetical protein